MMSVGFWKLEAKPKSHAMLLIHLIDSPSSLKPKPTVSLTPKLQMVRYWKLSIFRGPVLDRPSSAIILT